MRPGVGLQLHPDYVWGKDAVRLARLAEERGFELISVPEAWGRDAVTYLTVLAGATSRIGLMTGITPIFSRTPGTLAQSLASLDELSAGRLIAGIGVSGPRVVNNWHGQVFDRPLQRTREYIEILRTAFKGERVDFEGEIFHLHGFKLAMTPLRADIPIVIAGLSEGNRRLAGELADGWLPVFLSLEHLPRFREQLAAGATKRGRDPQAIRVMALVCSCVSGDAERDRSLVRLHIASYVGGMGTFYERLVSSYGFEAECGRIREEWHAGRRREAANRVSDAMLEQLGICGPIGSARQRLEDYRSSGVLPILLPPKAATADEIEATIKALGSLH